jgi:hypothetical protein
LNPTQGMDVFLDLFYICVVLCFGSGLETGWSLVQGVLQTAYKIKKLESCRCLTEDCKAIDR